MSERTVRLRIDDARLAHAAHELGPDGIGVSHIAHAVPTEHLDAALVEIDDPAKVVWRDNRSVELNERGVFIHQNYDAYALKLHHGDQEKVRRVPVIRELTAATENLIRFDFSQHFPVLADWRADEMAVHRYDEGKVGITPHRDQKRFPGLINVLVLDGMGEFSVRTDDGDLAIPVEAGDAVFMRGSGLYPNMSVTDRPLHGVTGRRTSLVIRANTDPAKRKKGFVYDNWPRETSV